MAGLFNRKARYNQKLYMGKNYLFDRIKRRGIE
jgi:hypothetical protein